MALFKYFIKVSAGKQENPANIRIRFKQGNSFDCFAQTGKSILPRYWNNEKGEVRKISAFKERDEIDSFLVELKTAILRAENNAKDKSLINTEWLVNVIDRFCNPEKYEEKSFSLFEFIEKFIEGSKNRLNQNSGRKITRSTLLKYGTCFNYLKDFAKVNKRKIDFSDIDLDFYNDFVSYLSNREKKIILKDGTVKIEKGLAANTIGKQIAVLKAFINAAIEEGHTDVTNHKRKRFKIITEDTDAIYLNEAELNTLYELELSHKPKLDKVRDTFLIGAWTGCRFSDLNQIRPENIEGNFVRVRQIKTDNVVLIPLHPVVKEILRKYNNQLPRVITNQKMNEYLKIIGQLAELKEPFYKTSTVGGVRKTVKYEKWELLSTHTARRSFATNLYKAGFPSYSIMQITAHRTEKAFLKYIKVTPNEHASKLAEFWQSKGEHLRIAK